MSKLTGLEIEQIFEHLARASPNPTTELDFTNIYTLLVAVVLSAQSTDKGVNKATRDLFKVVKTPEDMVSLGKDRLSEYIKTIGLYNTKAQNIIKLSEILISQHGSQVPDKRIDLENLPGVGRKTANVILNTAFQYPTLAVDTHVFRVSRRLGLATGETPSKVESELMKVVPKHWLMDAHHWLIYHGRYVCKARNPECARCCVNRFCHYKSKIY